MPGVRHPVIGLRDPVTGPRDPATAGERSRDSMRSGTRRDNSPSRVKGEPLDSGVCDGVGNGGRLTQYQVVEQRPRPRVAGDTLTDGFTIPGDDEYDTQIVLGRGGRPLLRLRDPRDGGAVDFRGGSA